METYVYTETHTCMCVYSSVIRNSQTVEATQVPINQWMNKHKAVSPCNRMFLAKRRNETLLHTTTLRQHYAEREKPVTGDQVFRDSIHTK